MYAGSSTEPRVVSNGNVGTPLRGSISKPRPSSRVSQDKKKGTASLPLNVLMDTIKESNLQVLQSQIQPMAQMVEKLFSETKREFGKLQQVIDERIGKLETRMDTFEKRMHKFEKFGPRHDVLEIQLFRLEGHMDTIGHCIEKNTKQTETLNSEVAEIRRCMEHVPKKETLEQGILRSYHRIQSSLFDEIRDQAVTVERKLKRSLASELETSIKQMGLEIQMDSAMVIKNAIDTAVNNMGIEHENESGDVAQGSNGDVDSNPLGDGNTNED